MQISRHSAGFSKASFQVNTLAKNIDQICHRNREKLIFFGEAIQLYKRLKIKEAISLSKIYMYKYHSLQHDRTFAAWLNNANIGMKSEWIASYSQKAHNNYDTDLTSRITVSQKHRASISMRRRIWEIEKLPFAVN